MISISVQIRIYYGIIYRDVVYPTNFVEGNKLKGNIFKFVWLQDICKTKMAAFKSFINKMYINLAGQCYLIRNEWEGGIIGANVSRLTTRRY